METLWQDIRYGSRLFAKKPGFAAVAVLTLALGIGANAAIFTVINAVLLKPLPYEHAERITLLRGALPTYSGAPSQSNLFDWREHAQSFEHLAFYQAVESGVNLTGRTDAERANATEVTASFFPTMGVEPFLGRTFNESELSAGDSRVTVIGYGLWKRRYSGDTNIIGQSISLNGVPFTVFGVMPAGFQFPGEAEIWVPATFGSERVISSSASAFNQQIIGRLKPAVSLEQAQAEMTVFSELRKKVAPNMSGSRGTISVVPLQDHLVGKMRRPLWLLFGAVGFVLLIACANVTHLLLSRATSRRREMAIRATLGASRGRLVRQLLVESVMLAVLGGAAGLVAALWGVDALIALSPSVLPRSGEIGIDARVMLFSVIVSLATGLLFGIAPAFHTSRINLVQGLKEGGLGTGLITGRINLRNLLVVAEIGLALVLLAGAGLLIKSFARLYQIDPGFSADGVVTAAISLPPAEYREPAQRAAFFDQLIGRLGALPGVESVSATNGLPLSVTDIGLFLFSIPDRLPEPKFLDRVAANFAVTSDYFRTMGIPVLRGRAYTSDDHKNSAPVVIVNETLAKHYWPADDPVGKKVSALGESTPREVVGVVSDVRHLGLENDVHKALYLPAAQSSIPLSFVAVRSELRPATLAAAIRREVAALDPNLPLYDVKTMDERLARSTAQRRFSAVLLGVFASLALVLATVGIFGVVGYTVTQRTHEIGVRIALGAQRRDVLRLVLGQGMALALIGVAVGLTASFAVTRLIKGLLYGVSATDPVTFTGVSVLLAAVALLACYIPARRAMKVDPMVALRYE